MDADRRQHRVTEIAIAEIVVDDPLVPVDQTQVDELAESIATVGLLQPVIVDGAMHLLAGRKRLAAVQRLGWVRIPALVLEDLEPPAEAVTLAENFVRHEMSPAMRAVLLARAKRAYEEKFPEAIAREAQRQGRLRALGHPDALPQRDCFLAFAAKALGEPKSRIGYYCRFSDWLGEPALLKISGTCLDSFMEVEALSEVTTGARDALIARAVAGEAVSARAEVAEHGYRRARTKIWIKAKAPSPPKKRGRPRKRPEYEATPSEKAAPSPPPPSAEPAPPPEQSSAPPRFVPGENAIVAAWTASDAFTRRAFVRAVRNELLAILKGLDVASAVPAPVFSLHA